MDAEDAGNLSRVAIKGPLSKEELHQEDRNKCFRWKGLPKYQIRTHTGFQLGEAESGEQVKLAYGQAYRELLPDLDIELDQIGRWEAQVKSLHGNSKIAVMKKLKFHYKKAIALAAPDKASGWNRWSDHILDLFLCGRTHRVLWGSGNCGKSQTMAILLYIKWRVRPHKRMVVLTSRVMTEAKERVIAYIMEIHAAAPASATHEFKSVSSKTDQAIYTLIYDAKQDKTIMNARGCIIAMPIKIVGETRQMGGNLKGKHPADQLIICFDEAQELPGDLVDMDIFSNWYTNENLEIHAWGNPAPIDFHATETHDLLYRLGARGASAELMKRREKAADKTTSWGDKSTLVLHLSMLDSPKDDPDEVAAYTIDEYGNKKQRLWFLAGKDSAKTIAENITPNSPAWFSQALGFPYINLRGTNDRAVLSASMVQACRDYPLKWVDPSRNKWSMGVDPSLGDGDDCSIVCAESGLMRDGRMGVDLHSGKYCYRVKKVDAGPGGDEEDFIDTTIKQMYKISVLLNIPLSHIAVDTHGTGEVFRYALQKHITGIGCPLWQQQARRGLKYVTTAPNRSASERALFKEAMRLEPAKNVVVNYMTEMWFGVRCAVVGRQMFNIPEFILQQFYNRQFAKTANETKYKLEGKDVYKARGMKSPNDADALVGMFEVIRLRGFAFKFADRWEYRDRYGEDYEGWREKRQKTRAIGLVSKMVGMDLTGGMGGTGYERVNRDGISKPGLSKLFKTRSV